MKILSPKIHGILDYVVVALFLVAPKLLGLQGTAALLSYVLAGVHFLVTVLTDFPLGLIKVIPLSIHGWIELAVAPTLIAVPWVLGFAQIPTARWFYVADGAVIFLTWLVTDYRGQR